MVTTADVCRILFDVISKESLERAFRDGAGRILREMTYREGFTGAQAISLSTGEVFQRGKAYAVRHLSAVEINARAHDPSALAEYLRSKILPMAFALGDELERFVNLASPPPDERDFHEIVDREDVLAGNIAVAARGWRRVCCGHGRTFFSLLGVPHIAAEEGLGTLRLRASRADAFEIRMRVWGQIVPSDTVPDDGRHGRDLGIGIVPPRSGLPCP